MAVLGDLSGFLDIDIAPLRPSLAVLVVRRYGGSVGVGRPDLGEICRGGQRRYRAHSDHFRIFRDVGLRRMWVAGNLPRRLLNGGPVSGWASEIGAGRVVGGRSLLCDKFIAGFQCGADALSCVVHGTRPDMVRNIIGGKRERPYLTSRSYIAVRNIEEKLAGPVVSFHFDGLICRGVGNIEGEGPSCGRRRFP